MSLLNRLLNRTPLVRQLRADLSAERDIIRSLAADRSNLRTDLATAQAARQLAWPRPAQRLDEFDVLAAFDVQMTEPWYTALHQELDDAIADLLDEVTQLPSATLTPERRLHLAGGAEALREFQKRLLTLRATAAAEDKTEAAA